MLFQRIQHRYPGHQSRSVPAMLTELRKVRYDICETVTSETVCGWLDWTPSHSLIHYLTPWNSPTDPSLSTWCLFNCSNNFWPLMESEHFFCSERSATRPHFSRLNPLHPFDSTSLRCITILFFHPYPPFPRDGYLSFMFTDQNFL